VENLTTLELETSWITIPFHNITLKNSGSIFHHSFFITNENNFIVLSTFEWFGEKCNEIFLKIVNKFDKKSQKWIKKLEYYKKFREFHGCELVMLLPQGLLELFPDIWRYSVDKTGPKRITNGLMPSIFEAAGKMFNFKAIMQPIYLDEVNKAKFFDFDFEDIWYTPLDSKDKTGQIFFYLNEIQVWGKYGSIQITELFLENRYRLYATPLEPYTAYDKLLFTFDTETWILLFVTFLVTIASILIINKLSKRAQNIVCSKQVDTPIWNVISIFFGISQTKLPTKKLSRFILTLFIFFCLILRTYFQSKSFEFMTSEPRRAPLRTIQDLIDNNYRILSSMKYKTELLLDDEVQNW